MIDIFRPRVLQLENGDSKDICEFEHGVDAGKLSIRRHIRGGPIHGCGGRVHAVEKVRNHRRHDAHRNVFSNRVRRIGCVGKLSSEDDAPGATRQVIKITSAQCTLLLIRLTNYNFYRIKLFWGGFE